MIGVLHDWPAPYIYIPIDAVGTGSVACDLVAVAIDPAEAKCGIVSTITDIAIPCQKAGNTSAQPVVVDVITIGNGRVRNPGAGRTHMEPHQGDAQHQWLCADRCR